MVNIQGFVYKDFIKITQMVLPKSYINSILLKSNIDQSPHSVSLQNMQENLHQMINDMVLDLLQICDFENINKIVKFHALISLRTFHQEFPNLLISLNIKKKIVLSCLKLVIQKLKFQSPKIHIQVSQFLMSQFDQELDEVFLQSFEYNILNCLVPTAINNITPFDLLNDLLMKKIFTKKTISHVSVIVDFTLTIPDTFNLTNQQILLACFAICFSSSPNHELEYELLQPKLTIQINSFIQVIKKELEQLSG